MKYLKKDTVKFVILLARACHNSEDVSLPDIGLIQDNPSGQTAVDPALDDPNIKAFNDQLEKLSLGERAELNALLRLGRDAELSPAKWIELVASELNSPSDALISTPKFKLPQYLRHGMERLARFKRMEQAGFKPSPPKEDHPTGPIHQESSQALLIGKFTMDAFSAQYGEVSGMKKLIQLLENKGYLDDAHHRALFGLPPKKPNEDFESILRKAPMKRDRVPGESDES